MAESNSKNQITAPVQGALNQFKEKVMPLLGKSNNARQIAVIALLSTLMAVAAAMILWSSSAQYVPLYGKQEKYDKSAIVDVLEAQGIDYQLDADTGNVLVPKSKMASARMKMASEGVTPEMPEGIESLRELSGLSTSKFMESNHYTHAVQGELAKTIMTIDGVRNARVHLAMPERKVFVGRDEIKPTASVVLDLANSLKPEQVEAIVSLVSGSIPDLQDDQVSVVDQRGNLLTATLSGSTPGRVSTQQMQYVAQLEGRVSKRAGDMLEPVIGGHNFRIRVAADVDFSTIKETREVLDETPVMVSEQGVDDSMVDSMAGGIPGALSNQPPMPEGEAEMFEEEDMLNRREEYSRRFETGRSITHTEHGESRLEKMSVSVVLNSNAAPEEGWSEEEIDNFRDIIITAAGIDEERGDTLSVKVLPFANAAPETAEEGKPWTVLVAEYEWLIRLIVGALLVLVIFKKGVMPLVNKVLEAKEVTSARAAGDSDDDDDEDEESNGRKKKKRKEIELPPPGTELENQLNHLGMLVKKQPDRTADIISKLIHDNEGSENG